MTIMKELNLDAGKLKTYLIFFGKSQSFSFTAFDKLAAVENFNETILDFDLLESQLITVDKIDNKPILAKYYFKRKRDYTLLKIFSYAQAYDGVRVQGSTFGVAFLSETNILVCRENIEILRKIKNVFADVCLDKNNKFNSSDFSSMVVGIWKQFRDQDGFSKIKYSNNTGSITDGSVGINVKSLEEAREISYSKMYFSEDIDHLKRANANWGTRFPLCRVVNGKAEFLTEHKKNVSPEKDISLYEDSEPDFIALKKKLNEKTAKIDELGKDLLKFKHKNRLFILINSIILLLLAAIISFIVWRQYKELKPTIRDINYIMKDQNNFASLMRLYVNICEEGKSDNPVSQLDTIIKDARTLKLPDDFVSFYKIKRSRLELKKDSQKK